ncbi:hypothetical protein [uncultured Pseudoflavonifractor sp.]|uniref:hypothetical protein n=1 Tax=uncultured Pseudoflavonifractor sp. TaxID=1221379 RepID=UPI0025FD2E8F|nr:hypothetical protein [uncultured Pseudoflavonifractor sp.]
MHKFRRFTLIALVLALLLLSGCGRETAAAGGFAGVGGRARELTEEETAAARERVEAQLGLLAGQVTEEEFDACLDLMEQLWPLRQERLDKDKWEKSTQEQRLVDKLNGLYEEYTVRYIGDGGTWGYGYPEERTLAVFDITSSGAIVRSQTQPSQDSGREEYTEADFQLLWDQMTAMLPEDAWEDFVRFTVFTDGENETLAYVRQADNTGEKWEIAVDPADAGDGQMFVETVLHEYSHYLTLNDGQVKYTTRQTASTYNELGMVCREGSYLDDFYQRFWTGYLDDRLSDMDTYNFFLRHEDDFVTDYASSSPSEDIAESFTYFVLQDKPREGDAVWEQKLNFFFAYPEMVSLRSDIRTCLGLS